MKPEDRVLKNFVKDVCSNINKGIFEFEYGQALLMEKGVELLGITENGMTMYIYEGITYTDYCSPSLYYTFYNEETTYHLKKSVL